MPLASLVPALLLALAAHAQEWERVLPGAQLSFPGDHGAHPDYRIEWWYVTGQVESTAGRRFGFQFTIFRRGLQPGRGGPEESPLRARQVFAGHLAVTDIVNGRTLFAERLRRAGTPLARAGRADLDLVLEDWSMRRDDDGRPLLSAGDATQAIGLELELVPRKPLVLHGQDGYSSKGGEAGNASAYVSWTRLATRGRLEVGGKEIEVSGEAWFDHEYGTSVLEESVVGWDWFGLQLDDGRELMLFLLRGEDGTPGAASAGTLIDVDGTATSLAANDFRIEVDASWTSPRSGATYPARWTLSIPSVELQLQVVPFVADSELGTTSSTGVAYWEGPVGIQGTVRGRGYAELTGYAGSMQGRL